MKISKHLGMTYKYADGRYVMADEVLRKVYYVNALKLLPDRVRDQYLSLYQ